MGILIMKRIYLVLSLIAPLVVQAAPSSEIAWTPALLKSVKNADASKGKALASAKTCNTCHGDAGISNLPDTPSLAGQMATYLYKQLRDYAKGSRKHNFMSSVATELSEPETADLAAWYSSLPLPAATAKSQNLAQAEQMVEQGDGKRILPPCEVCHGSEGQGEKMDLPALKGQRADYLVKTLLEFKTGQRHNDIYSRMRLIAEQLSEQEIKNLATFYQNFE